MYRRDLLPDTSTTTPAQSVYIAGPVHSWSLPIAVAGVLLCFTLTLPTAEETGPKSSSLPLTVLASVDVAAPW